jgi:lysozyme
MKLLALLTGWAYNVGSGAACRSTLAKRANAGDWRAACDQLLRWDRAGGAVVRGLTNRRAAEHRLCVGAL